MPQRNTRVQIRSNSNAHKAGLSKFNGGNLSVLPRAKGKRTRNNDSALNCLTQMPILMELITFGIQVRKQIIVKNLAFTYNTWEGGGTGRISPQKTTTIPLNTDADQSWSGSEQISSARE